MTRPLILGALAMLVALPALADLKNAREAKVVFHARGPAGFKIHGKSEDLSVEDDGKQVKVIVPLEKLETGIDLRDRHMREKYLEVDKHPEAVLTVPWAKLTRPQDGATKEGKAKGKLALHGRVQDVDFVYTATRKGDTYTVKGSVPVDLRHYAIHIPSYLGVTVKPNVDVEVEFMADER